MVRGNLPVQIELSSSFLSRDQKDVASFLSSSLVFCAILVCYLPSYFFLSFLVSSLLLYSKSCLIRQHISRKGKMKGGHWVGRSRRNWVTDSIGPAVIFRSGFFWSMSFLCNKTIARLFGSDSIVPLFLYLTNCVSL